MRIPGRRLGGVWLLWRCAARRPPYSIVHHGASSAFTSMGPSDGTTSTFTFPLNPTGTRHEYPTAGPASVPGPAGFSSSCPGGGVGCDGCPGLGEGEEPPPLQPNPWMSSAMLPPSPAATRRPAEYRPSASTLPASSTMRTAGSGPGVTPRMARGSYDSPARPSSR